MPTDHWETATATDTELTKAYKNYLRKTVRWSVECEDTSRTGKVETVKIDDEGKVQLQIRVHEEGEEPYLSTVSKEKVQILSPENRPALKIILPT